MRLTSILGGQGPSHRAAGPGLGPSLLAAVFVLAQGLPPRALAADTVPAALGTPRHVPGSTRRLAQLTGDYDPEGLPHHNLTTPWGVEGADLGANTEHEGRLFIFFGDVPQRQTGRNWPPHDADLIAYVNNRTNNPGSGAGSPRTIERGEIRLVPVLRDGLFHPFTEAEGIPGSNETPTGAFSHGGRAYVFVVKGNAKPYSVLTSSRDPASPAAFQRHFVWSDTSPGSGRFWQVAPWVLHNAEVPGLPAKQGDGVVLFGHGRARSGFGVHLAWLPLWAGREPLRSELRYYTGEPASPWSALEADAATLFHTKFAWTALSVGRIPTLGQWLLVSQRTSPNGALDEHIVARMAGQPWAVGLAAEVSIFDPVRDGALGKYIYRADLPDPNGLRDRPPRIGHPGFAYGAFLLNGYTQWDPRDATLTLYFLMSTGWPYQVQLMTTRIAFRE